MEKIWTAWKDIISIRGLCSNDTAKYYLDDIGISLLSASKIADERYGLGRKMIETNKSSVGNGI